MCAGGQPVQCAAAACATHVPALPVCVWRGGGGRGLTPAGGVAARLVVGTVHPLTC